MDEFWYKGNRTIIHSLNKGLAWLSSTAGFRSRSDSLFLSTNARVNRDSHLRAISAHSYYSQPFVNGQKALKPSLKFVLQVSS